MAAADLLRTLRKNDLRIGRVSAQNDRLVRLQRIARARIHTGDPLQSCSRSSGSSRDMRSRLLSTGAANPHQFFRIYSNRHSVAVSGRFDVIHHDRAALHFFINKSSCHHLVRCNIQDRKNTAGKQTQNIPAEIAEVKDKQVEFMTFRHYLAAFHNLFCIQLRMICLHQSHRPELI